jgi:hypothetical protein
MCCGVEVTKMNNFWEGTPTEALCMSPYRLPAQCAPAPSCSRPSFFALPCATSTSTPISSRSRDPNADPAGRHCAGTAGAHAATPRLDAPRRRPRPAPARTHRSPLRLGSGPRPAPAHARPRKRSRVGGGCGFGRGETGRGKVRWDGGLDEVGCRMAFYT